MELNDYTVIDIENPNHYNDLEKGKVFYGKNKNA